MRIAKEVLGWLYSDGENEEHPIDDGSDSEAEGSEADGEGLKLGTHFAFNAMVSSNDQ
jgi:hypothetical protein